MPRYLVPQLHNALMGSMSSSPASVMPLTQLMVPDTGQPKLFFNGRPQSPVGLQNCAYFRRPFEWLYHSSEVKKMGAKGRDSRHAARSQDEVPDEDSTSRFHC